MTSAGSEAMRGVVSKTTVTVARDRGMRGVEWISGEYIFSLPIHNAKMMEQWEIERRAWTFMERSSRSAVKLGLK